MAGRVLVQREVVAAPQRRTHHVVRADNEAAFLVASADDDHRAGMRDIVAARGAGAHGRLGSKSASLRLRTPDRAEPLSVAWTFLDGDQWYGARHLGVDPAALTATPSVKDAVTAYAAQVRAVEGGTPASGSLDAYTFAQGSCPGPRMR